MATYESLIKEEDATATFPERLLARVKLWKITDMLRDTPRDLTPTDLVCDQYNFCHRNRTKRQVGFVMLSDGVVAHYTTEGWLENRANRFIFPDEGEPSYHREPYHVDCQAIGSRKLEVTGAAELVKDRNITGEIDFVLDWVRLADKIGWTNLESSRNPSIEC